MTEREAENGQGVFKTLAPLSKNKIERSRKATALQRRKLGIYLQNLQAERAIRSIRPSAPETTLIARYIDMLGPEQSDRQPMSILGTWVQSIPARIGSNTMMDLAVEFLIDSYALFWNDTFSKRRVARASKEKALKELQVVVLQANSQPTYDVLLATKMHYAAEVCCSSHKSLGFDIDVVRHSWALTQCITRYMHSAWLSCSSLEQSQMLTMSITGTLSTTPTSMM
jgi:hypothetical protein